METLAAPPAFRGLFRQDESSRAVYSEAAGIGHVLPRAVAVPADADDVVALVRWAREAKLGLIPRGSGSSMAGGAIGDGVIVDLSRLRWLDSVNTERRTVRCGPGTLRNEQVSLGKLNNRKRLGQKVDVLDVDRFP